MTDRPTTMTERRIRCGDTVRLKAKPDEHWTVAYADYEERRMAPAGWPEGSASIEDVELVESCSDEEHKRVVAAWLDREGSRSDDHRPSYIERLYRPRAYWRKLVARIEKRMEDDREVLERCIEALRAAEEGPADV